MLSRTGKTPRLPVDGPMFNRDDPICMTCLDLNLREKEDKPAAKATKISYYEAVESALVGCRFCSLIIQGLKTLGAQIKESSPIVTVSAQHGKPFSVFWDDASSGRTALELFTMSDANQVIPELGYANEIDPDPASDASYELIRTWLNICENDHQRCGRAMVGPRPRRLIYVGDIERRSPPRLVEDYPQDVRYLALSHCWGTGNTFKTERSTRQQRKEGMDYALLPKTFQDAITVTSRLGFQYIWIDSLCIIQDDRQDWEEQSAIMGSIYEGSHLTIAASTSTSDQQGFLESFEYRFPYLAWDFFWEDSTLPTGIKVRVLHDARERFHEEPLSTRAWTFQERLLPRRLLTYSTALMWECEVDWCECGSGLFPDPFLASPESFYWPSRQKYRDLHNTRGGEDLLTPYEYWKVCTVESFMDRTLTRESDCLPAVSAIASKIHALTGDQYLAGLWRQNLPYSLTWRRDLGDIQYRTKGSHNRPGEMTEAFRAPSWSWASCVGSVSFTGNREYEETSEITVLEAECTLKGLNPFGEVTGGSLRINGQVVPMLFDLEAKKLLYGEDTRTPPRSGNQVGFRDYSKIPKDAISPWFTQDTPLRAVDGLDWSGKRYRTALRIASQSQTKPEEGVVQVICPLVSTTRSSTFVPTRNFVVLGGLQSPPGAYERIGFFFVMDDDNPRWFQDMGRETVLIF